jgi:hypothetical protein
MKTKDLIREWKQFITEASVIPLKLIKLQIKTSRNLEERELEETLENITKKWNSIFKKYSHVIENDLSNSDEPVEHILSAIERFSIYYNTASKEYKNNISNGSISSSDLRAYVNSKNESKKSVTRTKHRISCRSKANLSMNNRWSEDNKDDLKDFEVIYAGRDWTVIYPKTLLGSISWAVGLSDGTEEKYEIDENGTQIGRVTWCTASYENNRFPMYASNLHMYYFVKNQGYNINDIYRRLCISLVKNDEDSEKVMWENSDIVEIKFDGGSTVNGDNNSQGVSSLEEVQSTVNNQDIIDLIKQHATTKKSTSIEEMSSKVTLPILKQDEIMLADDLESLNSQIAIYLKYAKDREVINYIIEKYKDKTVLLDDLLFDYGPLPFEIFMRDDIESLTKKIDIIDRLIDVYKKKPHNISALFVCIIYSDRELGNNILTLDVKEKLFNYGIENCTTVGWSALDEYIFGFGEWMTFEDIIRLITPLKDIDSNNLRKCSYLKVLLQEIDFRKYEDHPNYRSLVSIIREKIFPKLDDHVRKKMLSKNSYFWTNENKTLKKYIRTLLS